MPFSMDLEQAYQYCQQTTRREARNFYFAFITLPQVKRRAIYAVYTFARLCDDIADGTSPVPHRVSQLSQIRSFLTQVYEGVPRGAVFTALADTVVRYNIPKTYFDDLISGVEMDTTRSRYGTFDELRAYCYGVASTVGLICGEIFEYRHPIAKEYAIDLGIAMQLTNILRDIGEDSAMGRVYLPQDEIIRFGYSEELLLHGTVTAEFQALMKFQVERARLYYAQGAKLAALIPFRSRACVAILRGLYYRLLDRIEENGYDVFRTRIRLPNREKLLLTTKLWVSSIFPIKIQD